jgi:hypothetical protein
MLVAGYDCARIAAAFGLPPLAAGGAAALCAGLSARGIDTASYARAIAERLMRYL